MEKVTKIQIQNIHTLLAIKHPHIIQNADLKADFVRGFTNDAERTSMKQLTYCEAADMLYFLSNGKEKAYSGYAAFDFNVKGHMKILSLAIGMGWTVYSEKLNRNVADLERIGAWIAKKSKYKKEMKKHTPPELNILIYQFEKMYNYELSNKHTDSV